MMKIVNCIINVGVRIAGVALMATVAVALPLGGLASAENGDSTEAVVHQSQDACETAGFDWVYPRMQHYPNGQPFCTDIPNNHPPDRPYFDAANRRYVCPAAALGGSSPICNRDFGDEQRYGCSYEVELCEALRRGTRAQRIAKAGYTAGITAYCNERLSAWQQRNSRTQPIGQDAGGPIWGYNPDGSPRRQQPTPPATEQAQRRFDLCLWGYR